MKRILTAVAVTFFLAAVPAAFGADGVKLGSVDIQKILKLSDSGIEATEQLAAGVNKIESEKNTKAEELKKIQGELEKQSMLLSEDSRKAKEQLYMQKRKEFDRFLKQAQEDYQAKNDELLNRIVEDVLKVIQEYGKKNGYSFIFVKNDGIVYLDEKADLTEEILKAFNAARKARK